MSRRLGMCLCTFLALTLWAPGSALASQLIDRNATKVKLAVSKGGRALLSYTANGKRRHVIVWGAVNALPPAQGVPQVQFQVDYTGGGPKVSKTFKSACRRYDGPQLQFLVAACKAPDGSYWAVQQWQYWLPFFGFAPWLRYQTDWALHISHWTGPPAELELWTDWYDARGPSSPHDLFGRYSYRGVPVHGFSANNGGEPTDGYGRVVYIEALDSQYGQGWWRVSGILTRNPSGVFCHAFVPLIPFTDYPNQIPVSPGNGTAYRVIVEGPGVTPDIVTEIADPGDFDPTNPADVQREADATSALQKISATTPICLRGH